MSIVLECKSITVTYGRKIRALKGLSMHASEGEIVALIGANGAGKSTFLKSISGLHKLESGEIFFMGSRIHHMHAHQISRLGIAHVPEGRRIFSRLTVLENLELGTYRNPSGMKENLDSVYELFPILKERSQQKGGTLSGGEQQMLAMGRALMSKPKLLVLDEPSMGLAPIIVDKIFQIIKRINALGTPIVLVEQNAHQSLSVAHRGYVLENGSVVLEGTGADLLRNDSVQDAYLGRA